MYGSDLLVKQVLTELDHKAPALGAELVDVGL